MLQKIKNALRTFMSGRHGADEMGTALLISGLVLSLIGSFTGIGLLALIGLVFYVWTVFRMFSRNNEKRYAENQKYLSISSKFISEIKQFFVRLKNIRKYKYFRCPQCKARLRLPRKVGEVTVTCGKCKNAFKQKA